MQNIGLPMPGSSIIGLPMPGSSIIGLPMPGPSIIGLPIPGSSIIGLPKSVRQSGYQQLTASDTIHRGKQILPPQCLPSLIGSIR